MDHGVGGGEVEADAAGLEADEEHAARRLSWKRADWRVARSRCLPVSSDVVRVCALSELLLDQRQHGGELREDAGRAAFVHQFGQHVHAADPAWRVP